MPRRPAAYPPAYRRQIIALARAGRTAKALTNERQELSRLRREKR